MARTTIAIDTDELERLRYYMGVFGVTSMAEIVKLILDKSGFASVGDIRELRRIQHKTDVVVEEE